MYLRELTLQNIKCFEDVRLKFPPPRSEGNWCVLLGDNGTGKSTILRAIALSVTRSSTAFRLVTNPKEWARQGEARGTCVARFAVPGDNPPDQYPASVTYTVGDPQEKARKLFGDEPGVYYQPTSRGRLLGHLEDRFLVAGYGPFRRLQSADGESPSKRLEENFRTLFDPKAGLSDLVEWLQRLDYLSKDVQAEGPERAKAHSENLQIVIECVNSLLPEDGSFRLEGVNSSGVYFSGPEGEPVTLSEMSDGYRTMFALAVDMLSRVGRPLQDVCRRESGTQRVYLDHPGIVLIDEADAHLHPRWQREIGFYLQRVFPRVQFIVSTHSPFIAQAASPGGIFALRWAEDKRNVEVDASIESLRGVSAEKVLLSSAFDLESTQDYMTHEQLEERARLDAKRVSGKLTADERKRLAELDRLLHSGPDKFDRTYESISRALDLLREAQTPDD